MRNPVVAGATPRVMPDAARLRAECVAKTVKARPATLCAGASKDFECKKMIYSRQAHLAVLKLNGC